MEIQQFSRRVLAVAVALVIILCCFGGVLYDLQIVNGAKYAAQSVRKIAATETVDASRGSIYDRYGRSLVSNRLTYKVTLDSKLMGDARNDTILALLEISRGLSVAWTDKSLPLTKSAPYMLTLATVGENTAANFNTLAGQLKWSTDSGTELMASLRDYFKVDPALADSLARDLVGVLYELTLRTREVVWSDYIFATDVDIDFISRVKEGGLIGVSITPVTVRQYNTTAAPHILGRTGLMSPEDWKIFKELDYAMNETVGIDGAERAFERWLRGTKGTKTVEINTSGKVVAETWLTEPVPGANPILTLDLPLQQKVEESLATYIPNLTDQVEGGACAIVDVNSGAILSLASYPDFDLTTLYSDADAYAAAANDPLSPLLNRATQGLYPPGSTYKMVTAIAALEEGIVTPSTRIKDTGIYTYYDDYQPACWIYRSSRGNHGWVNASYAIEVSCNVYFYDVGRLLGIQKLEEYARKFGLGEPTGVEIAEKTGVVASREYTESRGNVWYDGLTLSAAIGQENNQATPLQLANYIATLVNGGNHYSAHLLKAVKSHDFSQVLYEAQPTVIDTIAIDPANLKAVKQGMLGVTQSKTSGVSKYFADLDVKVGAKTGSAQVSAKSESNAVFVCFAPYDNPEIAIAITAEKGGAGAELAQVAADILSFYFSAQDSLEAVTGENELVR